MQHLPDTEKPTLFYYRGGALKPGGVEVMIARQAKWLQARSIVNPVVIIHQNNTALADFFSRQEIRVLYIPVVHTRSIFSTAAYLKKLIDAEPGKKILQSHLFRESIICRLVHYKSPDIQHLFRAETYIDCSEISAFRKVIYHLLDFLTQSAVNRYVANGNLVAKEIAHRSFVHKRKIHTVYNGCERFGEKDTKPIASPLRIAMVANLLPVKDHPTLFKALQACRMSGTDVHVDLFGIEIEKSPYHSFTSYKRFLEQQVAEKGISDLVTFRGFSSQLHTELERYQIIILTSISEGTANAIQEAMSVGKLIISSGVYELPYILDNGNCGMLFPSGDYMKLAEILKAIAEKPADPHWAQMRKKAAERWEAHFNTDTMMNQMSNLYRKATL